MHHRSQAGRISARKINALFKMTIRPRQPAYVSIRNKPAATGLLNMSNKAK
jgi:hypothetical protein